MRKLPVCVGAKCHIYCSIYVLFSHLNEMCKMLFFLGSYFPNTPLTAFKYESPNPCFPPKCCTFYGEFFHSTVNFRNACPVVAEGTISLNHRFWGKDWVICLEGKPVHLLRLSHHWWAGTILLVLLEFLQEQSQELAPKHLRNLVSLSWFHEIRGGRKRSSLGHIFINVG